MQSDNFSSKNQPYFRKFTKSECFDHYYRYYLAALLFILNFYISNRTLFFVLKHPGQKWSLIIAF